MRGDWKEIPLEHYTALFARLDPREASARCRLAFDGDNPAFSLRFMGGDYRIFHPAFEISGPDTLTTSEKILALRYLCEGRWRAPGGTLLSYRDIPGGELYFAAFQGRCIGRLTRTFGTNPALFTRVMEETPALGARKLAENHPAYRFEFFSNLWMGLLIWQGDDEFPPSAQIVFDDNVPAAFSAEDLAAVCEAVISRLKNAAALLSAGKD